MLIESTFIAQGSGKLGGCVMARNRGGLYLRKWVKPTDPASSYQVEVRARLSSLQTAWAALTDQQRSGWETYAANTPLPNRLGESRYLTGLQHYIRSNGCRLQSGLTVVSAAPEVFDLPTFTDPTLTGDESSTVYKLAYTNTDAWANAVGGFMALLGSRPQNPTRNYWKGPYRWVGAVAGAVVPPVSPASLASPWPLAEGQRVFGEVRVGLADGRVSQPFRLYGAVVA